MMSRNKLSNKNDFKKFKEYFPVLKKCKQIIAHACTL